MPGYIGPDPKVWVDRLIDVNDQSQFTDDERHLIRKALYKLRTELKENDTNSN